ncbi:MAG: alkane 1-monooxygenase [Burkholderiaceae bacterium]|nr:MAG: alkane 1-monooxygenase [Burkholderiaceae bacterium]
MKRGSGHRFLWAALLTAVPLPVIGWLLGQNWFTVALVVGVLPLADAVMGKDFGNPAEEPHPASDHSNLLRWNLYAYVPVQLAMIAWGAAVFAGGSLSDGQALGLLLSVGLVTGGQGITIAHELGHGRSAMERRLAQLLLVSVSYGHFHIEHNRGHHARVATRDDPATARLGEPLYCFLPRAIVGSLASAWQLEAARLRRRGEAVISHHNEMLWFAAATLLLAAGLGACWGAGALVFFAGQSLVAILLLEAVNYVEHYGLVRGRERNGVLERVGARHSWNASQRLSNALLINLQRHADHHANPSRPYHLLCHREDSPQLPMGYPGMLLLALVPPLWFRVMDPRVQQLQSRAPLASSWPGPVLR